MTDAGGAEAVPVIVFAIEPRAYREAIGSTVQHLRPGLRVEIVEPAALGGEVARLAPEVVFADRPGAPSGDGPHWVELRPYEAPAMRVEWAGESREVDEVGLDDLLWALDLILTPAYGSSRAAGKD